MRKAKLYFINSLTVSGVGLALRFAGMAYTVYISGKLGAEGMGMLTLLTSVYSLAVTLAVSGVNLTCTRLIADALALKNPLEARRSLWGCALYGLIFGLFSALLLFVLSPILSKTVLDVPRAAITLRSLCPSLLIAALNACFSGYFTAARRVFKTAFSSVAEQGLKMLFTVFLFSLLLERGMGVEAVMFSSCLSEFIAFLILSLLLFFDLKAGMPRTGGKVAHLPKRLLSISLPLAFAAWVRSALVTAEHVLIPRGLRRSGSASALGEYGVMHGMALPVVFFPYAVLTPFTSLLIPEISRFKAENKERDIAFVSSLTLRMTLLFASACSGLLVFFGKELGALMYHTEGVGKMISLFAFLIPVMYADTATDSILKGLGEQVYCMKVNAADAAMSLLLVIFAVPRLGAYGYLLTVFLSECVNTFFSVFKLRKMTALRVPVFSSIALPVVLSGFSCAAVRTLYALAGFSGWQGLFVSLFVFLLVYLPLCLLCGALSKEDRRYLFRLIRGK